MLRQPGAPRLTTTYLARTPSSRSGSDASNVMVTRVVSTSSGMGGPRPGRCARRVTFFPAIRRETADRKAMLATRGALIRPGRVAPLDRFGIVRGDFGLPGELDPLRHRPLGPRQR